MGESEDGTGEDGLDHAGADHNVLIEKWCSREGCGKISWDSMVGSYSETCLVKTADGKTQYCDTNGRVMKTDNNGNEVT